MDENEGIKRDLVFIKNKVKELRCKLGFHEWSMVASGKRGGVFIYLVKCETCGVNGERSKRRYFYKRVKIT